VPVVAKVADQLWPGRTVPESQTPVLVAVCAVPPRFVQVIVVPTGIVTSSGRKKKSCIETTVRRWVSARAAARAGAMAGAMPDPIPGAQPGKPRPPGPAQPGAGAPGQP
jgi:hypothetical protein